MKRLMKHTNRSILCAVAVALSGFGLLLFSSCTAKKTEAPKEEAKAEAEHISGSLSLAEIRELRPGRAIVAEPT